jgi:hypothetical protein
VKLGSSGDRGNGRDHIRSQRHVRSRNRLERSLRAQRWQHPQRHARFTTRRHRQHDHDWYRTRALADRARRVPGRRLSTRSWKTTLLAATTSSATGCTRPSPNSWRRPLPPSAPRGRSPDPTARRGPASATTSPKPSCSIRAPARPMLALNSDGNPPMHPRRRVPPRQLAACAGSPDRGRLFPGRGCFGQG